MTTRRRDSTFATDVDGSVVSSSCDEELPDGLTHPYDSAQRIAIYVHGHTFTHVRDDDWISIQSGRVINAIQQVVVVRDLYPGVRVLLGRRPLVGYLKVPNGKSDVDQSVLVNAADKWRKARTQR